MNEMRRALLSAASAALIIGPGLSSCSQPAEQNAAEQNAATPPAAPEASNEQAAAPQNDVTAQNAKGLLKAMSDYLAAQKSMSMAYDSIFEVVTPDHQKLQIATSGTIDLTRPDKIHTTRQSGFSDTEMTYDGKT